MRLKQLAKQLSQLIPHPMNNVELEQYASEGDFVAYWLARLQEVDSIDGQHVYDLGAGNGIIGIAALFMGANHVTFVEADAEVCQIIQQNLDLLDADPSMYTIVHERILESSFHLNEGCMVLMNPPWGVQSIKADRPILESAFASQCSSINLIHHANASHILPLAHEFGWHGEILMQGEFRLPPTYAHHERIKATTSVNCWRFTKVQ